MCDKQKKHCVHTANRAHINVHLAHSTSTTMIQLPRIDTVYSLALKHDQMTNNLVTFGEINKNYESTPFQLKLIV